MKLISVEISNIGKIEHIEFSINKPLLMFYGEPMQGKTTILESIRTVAKRIIPNDILRHGTNEGFIFLTADEGSIKRKFRRKEDGSIESKIECIYKGEVKNEPTRFIKQFVNPFLLDQDFFNKMTLLEKQRYFAEILDCKTDDYKKEMKEIDDKASELRAKIKAYGDIDITPIEKVDVEALKEEKKGIEDDYTSEIRYIEGRNKKVRAHNTARNELLSHKVSCEERIKVIQEELAILNGKIIEYDNELSNMPEITNEEEYPQRPDTSELDEKISQGYAQNVRREQYLKNMIRVKEREDDKAKLSSLEQQKRGKARDLINNFAQKAKESGIPDLTFDADGNIWFESTALDMLSNSQQMRLSSILSARYPEGFGIELLDRGESIFAGRDKWKRAQEFIERAEREKRAILTTIVGEQPADVPENIGLFVVEEGKLNE